MDIRYSYSILYHSLLFIRSRELLYRFLLASNERRLNVKFAHDRDEMVDDYLFRVEDREENVLSKKNQ